MGNAVGGFIFQWSDGWWKFGQESRLDIHDTNASWPNGGYPDFVEGENNMNEEWWGITAKGRPDQRKMYDVYPRAAYYALQRAFRLDPYAPPTDLAAIKTHFASIQPATAALEARAETASRQTDALQRVRVSGVRLEFETYSTGGTVISTPPAENPQSTYPSFLGFDHQQSFYTDFEVRPADNLTGTLSLNILGNVAVNPIDEIFYENRGRQKTVVVDGETVNLEGLERLRVYNASVSWDDRWFRLEGFYRTGHTHWGYEGDFFGVYREAFYGENLDIYNGDAPLGAELSAKKWLDGLKIAFGPQLWWGANPAFFAKYSRSFGRFLTTGLFQEEFAKQSTVSTSTVIPLPPTRRATLCVKTNWGPIGIELGGIWAGSTKVGEKFQIAEKTGDTLRHLRRRNQGFGRVRRKSQSHRGKAGAGTGTRRPRAPVSWRTADPRASSPSPAGGSRIAGCTTRRTSSPVSPSAWGNSRSDRTSSGRNRSSDPFRETPRPRAVRATWSKTPSPFARTARRSAANSS